MKKFEYKQIIYKKELFIYQLEELGKEGWELICIECDIAYFKRDAYRFAIPKNPNIQEMLDSPIDLQMLPTRAKGAIGYIGAKTFRDLINYGRSNILGIRNVGNKSRNDIDGLMEQVGLEQYWYGRSKLQNKMTQNDPKIINQK